MSNLKEKAKTQWEIYEQVAEIMHEGKPISKDEKWVLLSDAEAALNSAQSEIQQLKEEVEIYKKAYHRYVEKKNKLTEQVEAAKKIFKEQLLSDIITEKDYIEIMQILAGETTK